MASCVNLFKCFQNKIKWKIRIGKVELGLRKLINENFSLICSAINKQSKYEFSEYIQILPLKLWIEKKYLRYSIHKWRSTSSKTEDGTQGIGLLLAKRIITEFQVLNEHFGNSYKCNSIKKKKR